MNELEQKQLELEQESVGKGIERYRAEVEEDHVNTRPGKRLLIEMLKPMIQIVDEQKQEYEDGKPGRDAGVWKFLGQFSSEQLAFVTTKACINAISKTTAVQSVIRQIMDTLEATLNHEELKREDPKAYARLQFKIAKASHESYRIVVLNRQMKFAGVAKIKWGIQERNKAGLLLIKLLEQSTGVIQLSRLILGKNDSPMILTATEETDTWLKKSHGFSELLMPVYQPMIVQPREWVAPDRGGFLSGQLRLNIIKRGTAKGYLMQLAQWDMPKVYRAINAVQNTKWSVNKAVLRVFEEVWESGGVLGKLPSRDPLPIPTVNFEALTEIEQKKYRKQMALVHEENVRLRSKRNATSQLLDMARKFSQFDEFYYVYSMDWRGRIYPVSSFLNPQGNDIAKGLLQFAEGKPLGADGVAWLAVHGANSFGVDKVSFEDRIQWVQENEVAILESALNPLDGSRFWCQADNPWAFLAFCFEWLGYTMQGESFVSHLAVGLDGSNNGLQHLSALLRDTIGGSATNLVPAAKPADVYAQVAKVAQDMVDRDAQAGVEFANLWVGKVTRKIAKRPTMTLSYGASKYGFGDQLRDTVKKINEEEGKPYLGEGADEFKACVYLAGIMHEAIGQVVVAARQAMDWFQSVARVVVTNGLPIQWETPAGMLISQNYRKVKGERLNLFVAGQRVQLTLKVDTTEIDMRSNVNAVSPNVVHSLDASHMMLTVNTCLDNGIEDFAMVHDSYGTHACNVGMLGNILRDSFIEQYREDWLTTFRQQIIDQLPEEMHKDVPPIPTMGDLNLEAIRHSDYFFA